ncbi:glycosyltransferase family 2 protein [Psychrobacter sp. AOP29-E1-4]|uniref:glycosyltransferase family 2 protein n=1 Tax=Psychrobacter sp. AOP29-E1-4 TaxID=3457703 RepID=UPI0040374C10
MLLSIIIPVYNLEWYIATCLDSLIFEDIIDYEIIAVNDGSNDNSLAILKEYESKFSFITVIDKNNEGVSSARNRGMKQANGEFIWFFDGDDYLINDNHISKLVDVLSSQKPDIMFISVSKLESQVEYIDDNLGYKLLSFQEDIIELLYQKKLSSYCCDKVVKRKLLLDEQIKFPTNVSMSEDMCWSLQLFLHASNYIVFEQVTYIYRQNRVGAATQSLNKEKLLDMLWVLNECMSSILSNYSLTNRERIGLQLYISKLWFNLTPELINHHTQLYKENKPKLLFYLRIYRQEPKTLVQVNRGALLLENLSKMLGDSFGLSVYSKVIAIRRSSVIKKLYKG